MIPVAEEDAFAEEGDGSTQGCGYRVNAYGAAVVSAI